MVGGVDLRGTGHGRTPILTPVTERRPLVPWPATLTVVLILAGLDVIGWTSSGPEYRYVLGPAALVGAFAIDGAAAGETRRLRRGFVALVYVFVLWMAGIFTWAVLAGTWSSDTLIIFASLIPLALGPIAYASTSPRPQWGRRLRRLPALAATLYSWAALIDASLTLEGEQPILVGHEKAFIAVIVLLLPSAKRIPIFKAVMVAALAIGFSKYPSATVGLVGLVALGSVWMVLARRRESVILRAVLLMVGTGVLSANLGNWLDAFYSSVDRVDNTTTRLYLWDQAIARVVDSPLVGTIASEPITGLANIRGIMQPVPFHNTFLTLAFTSGVVGLVLLLLLIITALWNTCVSTRSERRTSLLWLPPLVAGLVTMSVNPILEKLGTALPFYALLLCAATPGIVDRYARYNFVKRS